MDLSTPTSTFVETAPRERLAGPDAVRGIALIGVVAMNYHGYLLLAGDGVVGDGAIARLFDPWNGPLSTRFAATFVLVAGVGITLLTRRAGHGAGTVTEMRWRLARRGVALYVVGLLLDVIWPGTIIIYYGVMFVLAAMIFTWRSRWIITIGAAAAIGATAIQGWRFERRLDGHDITWLVAPGQDSIRRYVFDVFVNGTHPLLPWFSFLCAGIVLGRMLGSAWWRSAAIGAGLLLVAVSSALAVAARTDLQRVLTSVNPYGRSGIFVASALGTALLTYAVIDWVAERFPTAIDPLRRAGQMSLTLYIGHILVFNLVVDWLGWVRPTGLDVAMAFALIFWILGIAAAVAWQRRFGRGPAEYVYRAFGG